MPLIAIGDELLEQVAEASFNASEQTRIHIEGEIAGLIPELMETLSPEGPYAYTILPEVRPDGSVRLPVLTTREQIRDAYQMIRGMSELLSVSALTEVRGEWYTFQDSISRTRLRHNGRYGASQTLALFPTGQDSGITGELVWARKPREMLGARDGVLPPPVDADPLRALVSGPPGTAEREQVFQLHVRYVEALCGNDAEAIAETLNPGVASAVRDYVNPTGTLAMLEGIEAHRAYYRAFFETFEVLSVQPLDRIAEDWYVFAEMRVTARWRVGADVGRVCTFNTAEFHVPANDGRFIARIGHGTDPCTGPGTA
ncbi:SnoaL-like domain-containing protein [Novosphingobium sp. CF614]|uniref:nuclear transport factor 2 family protein n=1 Tax=Novosphingobium sp. CF614 TaxID=1884364 RepID=UPI0008E9C4CF|nr:nuclear transport factor 2 family protein [Novosphingobium sp. CF614]SFF76970.1 SnoaL-like domain-containing protein [Novosphingobium sp. CF614]